MIYYLGVRFTPETQENLVQLRQQLNLDQSPMPKLGFHTTIAYSRKPFQYLITPLPQGRYFIHDLKLFNKSLVLTLNSNWLTKQHELVKQNGATWDQDDYIPHITIAEDQTELPEVISRPPFINKDGVLVRVAIEINEIFYREYF